MSSIRDGLDIREAVVVIFTDGLHGAARARGVVLRGAEGGDGDAELAEHEEFGVVGQFVLAALAEEVDAISSICIVCMVHNRVVWQRVFRKYGGIVDSSFGLLCPAKQFINLSSIGGSRVVHLLCPCGYIDRFLFVPCLVDDRTQFVAVEVGAKDVHNGTRDGGFERIDAHIVEIFRLQYVVAVATGGIEDARMRHGEGDIIDNTTVFLGDFFRVDDVNPRWDDGGVFMHDGVTFRSEILVCCSVAQFGYGVPICEKAVEVAVAFGCVSNLQARGSSIFFVVSTDRSLAYLPNVIHIRE